MIKKYKYFIFIALLIGLVYHNSLNGSFILDDLGSIRDNPHIRDLSNLKNIFDAPFDTVTLSRRPFTHFTFALNYAMCELRVPGYHVVNISIHIFSAWMLYLIVLSTLKLQRVREMSRSHREWLAFLVSLIWAIHPLNSQAVNYVVQRGELLSGFFSLFTLWLAIKNQTEKKNIYFILAILSCFLGISSKENCVMVPLIVLLYDRIFFFSSFAKGLARRWKLYLSLTFSWVIFAFLYYHNIQKGKQFNIIQSQEEVMPYLLSQAEIILHYLKLSLWPAELYVSYQWPLVESFYEVVLPSFLVTMMIFLTVWWFYKKPWLSFLGMWFFLFLAPTSSFYPLKNLCFEHRMYLPLIGFITGIVLLADILLKIISNVSLGRKVNFVFFVLVILLFGYLTYERNKDYQNERVLWEDAIKKGPNNVMAYSALGDYYAGKKHYKLAAKNHLKALELAPRSPQQHLKMADAYLFLNKTDQAIKQLQMLCEMHPKFYTPHYKLGLIYHGLGDHKNAIKHYGKVLDFFSDHIYSLNNLSWLLAVSSNEDIRNAKKSLLLALKVCELSKYKHPSYLMTLAAAYAESNDFEKALMYLNRSIELDFNQQRLKVLKKMKMAYLNQEKIYFDK